MSLSIVVVNDESISARLCCCGAVVEENGCFTCKECGTVYDKGEAWCLCGKAQREITALVESLKGVT